MSETPPNPYAAYPRPTDVVDSEEADRLMALWKGYNGLNYAFLAAVILSIGCNILSANAGRSALLIGLPIVALVIMLCSYPAITQIGVGLGRSSSWRYGATVLVGLNAIFCCGIVGFAVVSTMASKEMVRMGVPNRFMGGVKKTNVLAKVAELRAR